MKDKVTCAVLLFVVSACTETQTVDQCLRRQIFKECLAAVPKGPDSVVSNDWAEVVSECENAAYWQSLRKKSTITKECAP